MIDVTLEKRRCDGCGSFFEASVGSRQRHDSDFCRINLRDKWKKANAKSLPSSPQRRTVKVGLDPAKNRITRKEFNEAKMAYWKRKGGA